MKRWAETWSSFPAAHRKRCYQGLAAYGALAAVCGIWVSIHARATIEGLQAGVPSATALVKNVYTTPQITGAASAATPAQPPATPPPPPVADNGKTYVSVIVSGLGLSSFETQRAIDDLPAPFTLAFSPYSDDARSWARKAVAAHHETLMLAPMESANYPQDDPGPRALSSRLSDKDNNAALEWLLTQGDGAVGIMNMMGSRYLTDQKRLVSTFTTLRKNDALFIETPDIKNSAAAAAAAKTGLPFMEANLRIDANPTENAIREQLAQLEMTAQKHGYAIGIAHPYPITLNLLKSWAAGLAARGIILAPLKTVWKNKKHYIPSTDAPPSPAPAAETSGAAPAGAPVVTGNAASPPPQSQLRQP
ncbi:MAG: divergent polysaccharide deacetylase family protein [Alphaproteobacteria bacterium]|nr:divergent polysaccharide deacetylase family protein [Alphaproteobacteria bacterium]MDE2337037.1 divergent polysaccharide deacetylase family protein [Alphaproteobacteria bacterium]